MAEEKSDSKEFLTEPDEEDNLGLPVEGSLEEASQEESSENWQLQRTENLPDHEVV